MSKETGDIWYTDEVGNKGSEVYISPGGTVIATAEAVTADELATRRVQESDHNSTLGSTFRAERKLEFHTAAEIATRTKESTEWIVRPWVAAGAITEVDGKVKSAGKTTWVTYMCRAVLEGARFMLEPTAKSPVVYLTEQPESSFRASLDRAGLLGRRDFYVLFWKSTAGVSWDQVVKEAVQKCSEVGAKLLVVDTIAQFANLVGDSENKAGDALKAMRPLLLAAGEGLGIVVIRHERKRGGEVGSSGRGSSAFSGAVDIVLSLTRPKGNGRKTLRVITSLSRFDETPDRLTIELTKNGYEKRGNSTNVVAHEARSALLSMLPSSERDAMKLDDICAKGNFSRTTIQRAIADLADKISVVGTGKRGDPVRYYVKTESAQNPSLRGEMESSIQPEGQGYASGPTEAGVRAETCYRSSTSSERPIGSTMRLYEEPALDAD